MESLMPECTRQHGLQLRPAPANTDAVSPVSCLSAVSKPRPRRRQHPPALGPPPARRCPLRWSRTASLGSCGRRVIVVVSGSASTRSSFRSGRLANCCSLRMRMLVHGSCQPFKSSLSKGHTRSYMWLQNSEPAEPHVRLSAYTLMKGPRNEPVQLSGLHLP